MSSNFKIMNEEKRIASRHKIKGMLKVEDQVTGEIIGHIVDISEGGFMMQSPHQVPANSILQLSILMAQPIDNAEAIEVGAECIWSNTPSASSTCWCGFHIIDISDNDCAVLKKLITGE